MTNDRWGWLVFAVVLVLVWPFVSYQLAKWGEPQSLWLWRDVLGFIK